jgi:general secretion pathway protein N
VILALVLYAPARWLAVTVTWASQGHVALEDAQGTVWSGSAQWVLAGGRGSRDAVALPSRLAWTLRPTLGGLALAVQAPCCTLQPIDMQLRPTPQGLTVTLADVAATHWPAQLLAGLGTPWNTLQLEGQLQLAAQGLQLQWTAGRLQVQGRAELLALNMGSRLTTLRPMGSYRLALEGGAVATLRLETLEGGLRLAGTGEWRASGLHFSGVATTAPQHAAVLANLLNLIGRREGDRSIITLG